MNTHPILYLLLAGFVGMMIPIIIIFILVGYASVQEERATEELLGDLDDPDENDDSGPSGDPTYVGRFPIRIETTVTPPIRPIPGVNLNLDGTPWYPPTDSDDNMDDMEYRYIPPYSGYPAYRPYTGLTRTVVGGESQRRSP